MNKQENRVEILEFQNGIRRATVVTDGTRTKSFENEGSKDHATLNRAIAYLESRGYRIRTEGSEGFTF